MLKQIKKLNLVAVSQPTDPPSDEKIESGSDATAGPLHGPSQPSSSSQPNSGKRYKKLKKSKFSEDSIISTLIAYDTQTELAPAIKSIFEQKKENEFIRHLSSFIANREQEIERICQNNFESFIRSVDNLVAIRVGIEDGKRSIVDLNKELQITGKELASKTEELSHARTMWKNLNDTIESVNSCHFTFLLCKKIRECIDKKRFYPAIKILEQLQQVHLNNIMEYEIGIYLHKMIPQMRKTIKKRALDNVSNWLLTIRNLGGVMGEFALAQTKEDIRKKEELMDLRRKGDQEYTNVIIKKRQRAASTTAMVIARNIESVNDDITEVSIFEKYQINFAPLYQCSYIYEVLEEKEEFRTYYKENRKLQLNLVLQQPNGVNFTSYYKEYCHQIAGFFIVEANVLQTSNDLINKSDVASLWNTASNKLRSILQVEIAYIEDKKMLPELKSFFVVFCRTLRKYGYHITLDYM